MKKILLVIPILLSYSSKGMENPNTNIDPTVESVRPGDLINKLEVYTEILEGICEVADVLGKRKQTEEHGNQNQSKKAKKFKCDKCGHWYASKSGLSRHMQTHNTGKPYECDVEGCQEKFKTRASLSQHTSGVHGFKMVCGIKECTYETGFKSDLKKHKKSVHEKRKDYTCDQCDYVSASKFHLNDHKETHNKEKSIECDVEGCQEKFKTRACLRMHRSGVHGSKEVCGIGECTYEAGLKAHLKRHKRHVHGVQKDYTCDQCDYAGASPSNLKEHMETHNTGKPFECNAEGCQKKFKTRSRLKHHKNSVHDPKIVCGINECTYETGLKADLKTHKKRIHGV